MNESLVTDETQDAPGKLGPVKRIIARLNHVAGRVKAWQFSQWAKNYNYSQWCYFIASMLLLADFLTSDGTSQEVLAGWVAFFGLTRELLHLFKHMWNTMLGKSVILILYASTANIALAYAAMQINAITGIEPTPFIFTLGFTTLVLLPVWVTISTTFLFLLFLIAANLWLLIRLPLKLFGFNVQLHWEDKKRAFLTMILRIFLIPFAVVSILTFTHPYFASYLNGPAPSEVTQKNTMNDFNNVSSDTQAIEEDKTIEDSVEDLNNDLQKQMQGQVQAPPQEEANEEPADFFNMDFGVSPEDLETAKSKNLFIQRLIAGFIWHFESYPHSHCEKPSNARSVPIDENSVLFVLKDKTTQIGYRYEVALCKIRQGSPEMSPN